MINLIYSKSIVSKPIAYERESGATVGSYVDSLTSLGREYIVAVLDGVLVTSDQFDEVIVTDGSHLTVAIVPAEPVTAAWAGASLLAKIGVVTAVATAMYAGYMMYSMEVPDNNIPGQEKANRIDGTRNGPKKYEPVPVVLGKRRVAPDWAANPYIEADGEEQYQNLLLSFGYGPLHVENFRIGDTPIDEYEGVTLYHPSEDNVVGFLTKSTSLANFWPADISQELVQVELAPGEQLTRTTSNEADEIEYSLFFPRGLVEVKDDGDRRLFNFVAQTMIKKSSDTEWSYLCHYTENLDRNWIGSGEVWKNAGKFYFVDGVNDIDGNQDYHKGVLEVKNGVLRDVSPSDANGSYHSFEPIREDPVLVYVTEIPSQYITYEDTKNNAIIVSSSLVGSYGLSDIALLKKTNTPFFVTKKFTPPAHSGTWDIQVSRHYPGDISHEGRLTADASWDTLTTRRNFKAGQDFYDLIGDQKEPVTVNGVKRQRFRPVVVGVRIKATHQLNGMLDKLNADVTSVVPADWNADWRNYPQSFDDPTSWYKKTDNPAEVYRWLLQGPFNANAVGNNKLHLESLAAWRDRCAIEGWRVSGLLNFDSTLMVELNNVAFAGRAEFSFIDGKYGVVEKIERTLPVQMFTSKNSWGFASSRSYPETVDGIKFEFEDEDQQYEKNEDFFYDPAIPVSERTGKFQGADFSYITNRDLAYRHARFIYYEQALRRESYTLTTDVEGLVCGRGDLVRLNHDMIDVGLGAGRVLSAGTSTFTFDEEKDLQANNTYGIQFRNSADGVIQETVTTARYEGERQWTVISGPVPEAGDFAIYGVLGEEAVDCIVQDVTYHEDLSVDLTLVNAANEIYTRDGDFIPVYDSALTPRIEYKRPNPPWIRVPEGPKDVIDGKLKIRVFGSSTQESPIRQFMLQYRSAPEPVGDSVIGFLTGEDTEGWESAGVISATQSAFEIEVDREAVYQFRARAVGENNLVSAWSEIAEFTVSMDPSAQVGALTLTELYNTPKSPNASLSTIKCEVTPPADPHWAYAVIEYRVFGQSGWFYSGRIGALYDNRVDIVVPSDGTTYEVQARSVSTFGTESYDGVVQEITVINIEDGLPPDVVDGIVNLVAVTGLQVEGGGTEFGGDVCKVTWEDPNRNELHFREYAIVVLDTLENVLRYDVTTDPHYAYTAEMNAEDYERVNLEKGINRTFSIQVRVVGRVTTSDGLLQSPPAEIVCNNPPPGPPTQIDIQPGFKVGRVHFMPPADLDYTETAVWVSTTTPFDINGPDAQLVATGRSGPIIISNLETGSAYYVKMASYDTFGIGSVSGEHALNTFAFEEAGFSAWAHVTQADRDFINEHLDNDSLESTKIANVTASKITTGILAATSTITAEGQVESITKDYYNVGGYRATLGPRMFGDVGSERIALLSYDYNGQPLLAAYEDGNLDITGNITITNGSGYSNLSDKPTTLADINAGEVSVLYSKTGTFSWPGNTNLNGAVQYNFDSPSRGDAVVAIELGGTTNGVSGFLYGTSFDADGSARYGDQFVESTSVVGGGVKIAINGVSLTGKETRSGLYLFKASNIEKGNNTLSLWNDGAGGSSDLLRVVFDPVNAVVGADITGENVAADVRYVNGVLAATITQDISDALTLADNAQATADGKIQSYYQSTAPSGMTSADVGDIWYDTAEGNKAKRWSGSQWVSTDDSRIAQALEDAANADAKADGKVTTFFTTAGQAAPTAEALGDLWYHEPDNELRRWSGSQWLPVGSVGADWNSTLDGLPERFYNSIPQNILDNGGLIMTDLAMGYYNPTIGDFQALIGNDGSVNFGGIDDNYIDYNGSQLVVQTPNFKINPDGSVNISSDDLGSEPVNVLAEDLKAWTVGTSGSQGAFSQNGTNAENSIISGKDFFNNDVSLWVASPDATSDADGGWNVSYNVDSAKSYRSTVWVYKNKAGGSTYLGWHTGGNTLNLDGTVNSNPYAANAGLGEGWYLLVGIIHHSGYTGGNSGLSGFYDAVTGELVQAGNDYKLAAGATVQTQRAYLYYCTDTTVRQQFANPRVEVLDGKNRTIEEMLGSVPMRFRPTASQGLNLTSTHMGYYNGTSWGSYIQDDGNFHFGSSSNYVSFNGTNLNIVVNAIGSGASVGSDSVAFGSSASAAGSSSVAIGNSAAASYSSGTAIGTSSIAGDINSVAIGTSANAGSYQSIAIGRGALVYSTHSNAGAIGTNVASRQSNYVNIGPNLETTGNCHVGGNHSISGSLTVSGNLPVGGSHKVGTLVFARLLSPAALNYGSDVPGSYLRPCAAGDAFQDTALSGTYKCLGHASTNYNNATNYITLFIKRLD